MTRFLQAGFLVAVLGLLSSTGCGEGWDREFVSQGRSIYYGTVDNVPSHAAVVAITDNQGYFFCTGTLISPNYVLTAGHCVEGETASRVRIFFGPNANQPAGGSYVQAAQLIPHPQYNGSQLANDIALIRMQSNAPAGIAPIPHLPASLGLTSADVGQAIDFSGFGVTETGSDGVKLHVSGTIGLVCAGPSACYFDGNQVVARAFAYNQSGTIGGPCSGDSGGPAFIFRGGTEYVAGVTSYGDARCREYGVSSTVSAHDTTFIAQYVSSGPVEDCTNGVDDDDDQLVDCLDPDCASHPACIPNACDSAPTLGCGASLTGNTSGGASVFSSYGCGTQGSWDGPERAYLLDIPAGVQVTVNMDPTTGNNDLDLFILGTACDPQGCLGAGLNEGSNPESVTFSMPAGGAYAVVETWNSTSAFNLSVTCTGLPEVCDNGVDDDGDQLTDCDDPDCASAPSCQLPPEDCENGLDDDRDGLTDCDDPDCASAPSCQLPPEDCENGLDDDRDGLTDCDDPDCASAPACQIPPEDCGNGLDDDRDGQTDCDDPDCASAPACQIPPEDCGNGLDDDRDGLTDCDDPDCASAPACQIPPEDCENGLDDDRDGQTDCDDPDCASAPACQIPPEDCENGLDDDRDGQTDCDDPDCASAPACQIPPEDCGNGLDDDGDGLADCLDPDCAASPLCQPGVEQCGNGLDDDGDGLADCLDPDCAASPLCQPGVEQCGNGLDDDGDGLADCLDPDCAASPLCQPGVEQCGNGLDDDGDGLADCLDPDCVDSPACKPYEGGGGCGCAASGDRSAADLGLLGLVVGLVALARRRRR
jgi:MYXO-CTERM domain-containing protein